MSNKDQLPSFRFGGSNKIVDISFKSIENAKHLLEIDSDMVNDNDKYDNLNKDKWTTPEKKSSTPKRSRQRDDEEEDDEEDGGDYNMNTKTTVTSPKRDDNDDHINNKNQKKNKNDNKSKSAFQTGSGKEIRISNDKLSEAFTKISVPSLGQQQNDDDEKEIDWIQEMYTDILNYLTLPFHKDQQQDDNDDDQESKEQKKN